MSDSKKIIIVTGGNSGVGLGCCLELAALPNVHIILVGHNHERIDAAVAQVEKVAASSTIVEGAFVELASLASVKDFCNALKTRQLEIACLICNAAAVYFTKELTGDGFERILQINHISHFLMVQELASKTKRILTLGSGVHDPAHRLQIPPANISDLDELAVGYAEFDGDEAYSTTKLLAITTAREFARRHPNGPEILSYSPGFILDTGLNRLKPQVVDMRMLVPILRQQGIPITTTTFSGSVLARVATAASLEANGWTSGDYMNLGVVTNPSKQAQDPEIAAAIWAKSEEWIAKLAATAADSVEQDAI